MNLGPNRGIFDCRSLLGGLMGVDAAGKYFAHRQLVFFSIHWMMWISTQRCLRKALRSTLNPKTGNPRGHARPDELFWNPQLISLQHCTSWPLLTSHILEDKM